MFCDRIAVHDFDSQSKDGRAISFAPLNPVTPGHLLVLPRFHVPNAAAAPHIAGTTMVYAAQLVSARGDDCNLITSIGPAATQTIQHLHIHLVPRRVGDGLHLPWTVEIEKE